MVIYTVICNCANAAKVQPVSLRRATVHGAIHRVYIFQRAAGSDSVYLEHQRNGLTLPPTT